MDAGREAGREREKSMYKLNLKMQSSLHENI